MSNSRKYAFGCLALLVIVVTVFIIYLSKNKTELFIITFDSDGGSIVLEQSIEKGGKVTKPESPIKDGYIFDNWYMNGVVFDFNAEVTADMILTAKWITNDSIYKVTFDSNGGSTVTSQTIDKGDKATEPEKPTKKGYDFIEWQLEEKKFDFNTVLTENITLKAVWKENKELENLTRYTVTFNSDGGSAVTKQSVVEGNAVNKPTNPTKSGYNFVEWQLNGKAYNFGSKVTGNITLKATWKEKTKVTVTFNSDGGTTVAAKTVYTGDKLGTVTNPTKDGFTFDGWYSGSTKYTASSTVSSSITLTAKWIDNDQLALNAAKTKVTPVTITSGGQTISYSSTGCIFAVTPAESIASITRGTENRNISISVAITCGSKSETVSTTGTIQKSNYKYTTEDAGNQTNFYVRIGGLTNYTLFNSDGRVIGRYSPTYTGATVTAQDIGSHPVITLKLDSDPNTSFAVTYNG